MVIRAAGENWIVEQRDPEDAAAGPAGGFVEVSFRPEGRSDDRVAMRWVPRPRRLSESVASRIFRLAGERVWTDPRSGVVFSLHVLDDGADEFVDARDDALRVRIRWKGGEVCVPYVAGRPLGLLGPEELQAMLDRALEGAGLRV